MDNSKTVDLEIAGFFKDHNINDFLPSLEGVAMTKTVIDKVEVTLNEDLLFANDVGDVDLHEGLLSTGGIGSLRRLESAEIFT